MIRIKKANQLQRLAPAGRSAASASSHATRLNSEAFDEGFGSLRLAQLRLDVDETEEVFLRRFRRQRRFRRLQLPM